jgi:uncharacterized protein YndB with AHSA1/START domain
MRGLLVALALGVGGAGPAMAAEVERSIMIDRPPAEVWAAAGPFCAIRQWHPAVARCELLEIDGKPYRRLELADGTAFLEREVERDEAAMRYRYAIERSPLPVADHGATLRVEPAGTGARVTWQAELAIKPGASEAEIETATAAFYEAGLKGLWAGLQP